MGFYACLATVAFCSRAVHDFLNNLSYLARFAKQRVFIWLFKFDFGSFWDLIGIPMAFHEHLLWFPHGCALFHTFVEDSSMSPKLPTHFRKISCYVAQNCFQGNKGNSVGHKNHAAFVLDSPRALRIYWALGNGIEHRARERGQQY